MYDPHALLQGVDDRVVPFLLLSGLSFAGLIVWYRESLLAAERDRCASMAPILTLAWLVHDTSIVVRFPDWFGGTYDHWLMQVYWVAITGTAVAGAFQVVQLLRFGRDDLAPGLPEPQYRWGMVAVLVATTAIGLVLKRFLDDDLFQVTFGITAAMFPPTGIALLLRRGDRRGQTVGMWAGFTTAAGGWWLATYVAFGPAFRSAVWVALGLATVLLGAVGARLVATAPEARSASWPRTAAPAGVPR